MAINFPASPSTDETYTENSITWVFNGTAWNALGEQITPSDIGLGNVDNTADTAKPVSTAQQTAIDLKQNSLATLITSSIPELSRRYQRLTDCSDYAAGRHSEFLKSLERLGLDGDFVDGMCLRSDMQASSGSTLYSINLETNMTITGSPERTRNGIQWDGASYAAADLSSSLAGAWTVMEMDARERQGSTSGTRIHLNTYGAGDYLRLFQSGINYTLKTSANSGTANFTSLSNKSVSDPSYEIITVRNADPSASGSLEVNVDEESSQTTTGRGNVVIDEIWIGAGTDNGSTPVLYSDSMSVGWLIFDRVLTDVEASAVRKVYNEFLHPNKRVYFEGDSMSYTSVGLGYHVRNSGNLFGFRMETLNTSTGGETTIQMVTDIGNSNGINDQADDGTKTICLIHAGSNDTGDTVDGAATHANLRTLWQAARDRGMIVVAVTIPGSTNLDAIDWDGTAGTGANTERAAVNALIQADDGILYDYLLDVDQILTDEFGALYWQDTNCFSDGTHYGQATGAGTSGKITIDALGVLILSEIT